jgi:hypothetical protein
VALSDLLRHRNGDQIADAVYYKDGGEESKRCGLDFECSDIGLAVVRDPGILERKRRKRTSPIASPKTNTRVWSAIVAGDVRKKKPSVIWKRDRERMIVFALTTAMTFCSVWCLAGFAY